MEMSPRPLTPHSQAVCRDWFPQQGHTRRYRGSYQYSAILGQSSGVVEPGSGQCRKTDWPSWDPVYLSSNSLGGQVLG
jgi:hypothetical protein